MIRNFIIAVLVVLVIVVAYVVWNQHHTTTLGDGSVAQNTSASGDQSAMNSGVTTSLDGTTEAHPTPSRSDAPGTINTEPVGSTGTQNTPTMGTPMGATSSTAPNPVQAPGGLTARGPVYGPSAPPPSSDSLPSNPPNHVAFGGTGKYMWYRQGDLTWRVNSDTGSSCIAFATMEQWARPVVYQNGCDSRRS